LLKRPQKAVCASPEPKALFGKNNQPDYFPDYFLDYFYQTLCSDYMN
jgi:hypothetical protein